MAGLCQILGLGVECLYDLFGGDAAEGEDAEDGFFDEVVGAGGAGGDADADGGLGVEEGGVVGGDFLFGVEVEMGDFFEVFESGGISDEEGGDFGLGDFDEVGGV